jgi:hypothetical protein
MRPDPPELARAAIKAELREIALQLGDVARRLARLQKSAQRLSAGDAEASASSSALEAAIGCLLIDRIRPACEMARRASSQRRASSARASKRRLQ